MKPTATEIREAAESYLRMLEDRPGDEDSDLENLAVSLDRLIALGRHSPDGPADEQPDPPDRDGTRLRKLSRRRFPWLGHYNVPADVSGSIGSSELMVGDAIDDLADIAGDLSDVAWAFDHTSEQDALWHFRFGFDYHWGAHAANLRWYLDARRREA